MGGRSVLEIGFESRNSAGIFKVGKASEKSGYPLAF